MKLSVPFLQLPLRFDAERLQAEVAALGEAAWRPHPQRFEGNFALPLVAVDGDPDDESVAGPMQPTPFLQAMPTVRAVLAEIGGVWGRSRLMRLAPGAEVAAHVDTNYYWRERMRVHVPIATTPEVRFHCGGADVHMAAGECWVFDTWQRHRVSNGSGRDRIHLVADTVGGERLWGHLRGSRPHGRTPPGWRARTPVLSPEAPLRFERSNVPRVMTPWELREHLSFVLAEAAPDSDLAAVQPLFGALSQRWQVLWACHGDARDGWPEYRALLDAFAADLREPGVAVRLRNGVTVFAAVSGMLLPFALRDRNEVPVADEPREATPARPVAALAAGTDGGFDRPVFIVSAPRSGSTLLFETLCHAPALYSIGGESHGLIEGVPALHPAARDFASNALTAADASPQIRQRLRGDFLTQLRDRHGRAPTAMPLRMLEKTPKNTLRIPFLDAVFEQARYVLLLRDVRANLASMIDAWQSGRFVTYPRLPGWTGPPWSLLLTPGWQTLAGAEVPAIVAGQWRACMDALFDALEALPPERVVVLHYEQLLAAPEATVVALCRRLDLDWDARLHGELPLSQHTLTPPAADKWRRHEAAIEAQLPQLAPTLARWSRWAGRALRV